MSAASAPWWGWHQLVDEWAARVVADAHIRSGELVLDIGAGNGALTAPLVQRGARVIAVERHPERARRLRARFDGADVIVVQCDASDLRLPRRPFRVVANPPFGISTSLLRRLLAPGSRMVRADIVLPAHVCARWSTGRAPAAARWGEIYDVTVGRRVPRSAFRPPPPVATSVLRIAAVQTPPQPGMARRNASARAR